MQYLTLNEINTGINSVTFSFAGEVSKQSERELYSLKTSFKRSKVLCIYMNTLSMFDPEKDLNYLNEVEVMSILSKIQ